MDKALTLPELLETVPNDARLVLSNEDERGVDIIPVGRLAREAAAEMRRLQALLEAEQALHQRVTYPELQRLRAQRDALLELLKLARSIIGHPDDAHTQMIDAAIKSVEEGK